MTSIPSDNRPRIITAGDPRRGQTLGDRVYDLEKRLMNASLEIEALQRHRFAVSVFLGLGFRKRLMWLFRGARAFQPKAQIPNPKPPDGVSL